MLVQHFLEASAKRLPDKTALVCDERRLTYAQIDEMANRLANAFIARGIRRGDRVGIYLNNTVEAVVGIFAALKADAVFVPVNHTTKLDKLAYIINNCEMRALLLDARDAATSDALRELAPSLILRVFCGGAVPASASDDSIAFDDIQTGGDASQPRARNIDLDLACLIYTSGSTGDPKGVMSDHSNVVFASGSIIEYLGNVEDDIVICVSPLSFDYGLYQLLMVFRFGGTLILERGFAFPADFLKRIETERVTGLPGVPTVFAVLIQQDLASYDLSSLRYLSNTAAALPPSHILELQHKFPHTRLFSMYGLTETKRTLYLPPEQLPIRPGSVGIAIPGTEVWVEGENGERLGPGEVGELVVRGRHVMRGYWNNPEATAVRYRPGATPGERLCYTGDLFRTDDEGYLYFVARKDDIIKSRGEKVAPKEVEIVLYQISGVREAAVVGVPDPILGSAVKAFLVSDDATLTEQKVIAHCRKHLEDFMVPKFVEFRSELPKTSSGKIKKTDLN
jgi:amino acid adenylation domain-containing protein